MEIPLRKYGTNSAYAVMRLLAMANIVKKKSLTTNASSSEMALLRKCLKMIFFELLQYEIDVAQAPKDEQCFNEILHYQKHLQAALDEIEGHKCNCRSPRLCMGYLSGTGPEKEEVYFVEHAVGYWGIGEA